MTAPAEYLADLYEALQNIDKIAREQHDGHYTIMSFTTGYKVFFGTPSVDYPEEYNKILAMKQHKNIIDAIKNAGSIYD